MHNYKFFPVFLWSIFLVIAIFLLYPFFQYAIDPDGVAYLTISKRYASGDFQNAINGYWSPWSCWLTSILIQFGIEAVPSSICINTIAAIGFLVISNTLFNHLKLRNFEIHLMLFILGIFLCFAVYWQTFDDLWMCLFLLLATKILLIEKFIKQTFYWIILGFVGALSYFSKAYALPFFITNTLICVFILTEGNLQQVFKITVVIFSTFLITVLPWILLLYNKYGFLTTSTAGVLNLSWYLIGHPIWKANIHYIIPPTLPYSLTYWEDPYLVNAQTPHFWNNASLFGLQLLRIALTIYKYFISMIQISIFFPIIWISSLYNLITKKLKQHETPKQIITIIFLVFPLGYFLINFESRYIWFMLPLSLILGFQLIRDYHLDKKFTGLISLFILSFSVYPIYSIFQNINTGNKEYQLAQQLRKEKLYGSFTSNLHPSVIERLAYFSHNPYFYNVLPTLKQEQINTIAHLNSIFYEEMKAKKIAYYYYFTNSTLLKDDNIPFKLVFNKNSLFVYKIQ